MYGAHAVHLDRECRPCAGEVVVRNPVKDVCWGAGGGGVVVARVMKARRGRLE